MYKILHSPLLYFSFYSSLCLLTYCNNLMEYWSAVKWKKNKLLRSRWDLTEYWFWIKYKNHIYHNFDQVNGLCCEKLPPLIIHPPIVFILDVVLVHCVLHVDSFLFIYCVTFIVNKLFKNANTTFQLRPYNKKNSKKLYNFDFFTLCYKGEYTVNDYRV